MPAKLPVGAGGCGSWRTLPTSVASWRKRTLGNGAWNIRGIGGRSHPHKPGTKPLNRKPLSLSRDLITYLLNDWVRYRQGGTAGFGLRRVLLDQSGAKKGELKMGEQKSIQTDRVVLVPGPAEEVATVRGIYEAFVSEGKLESEIAVALNAKGIRTDFGRAWNRGTVHQVLTNEKYIGNNVYHRTSFKLKRKHVMNPPDRWIRAEGVFEGIVEAEIYLRAREMILARSQRLSDEEMLEKLRALLEQHGRISGNPSGVGATSRQ